MEIKVLKAEEYDLLDRMPKDEAVPLSPDSSIVVLATDGEEVVGRMVVLFLPHIEGTWVHPDYRKGYVGYMMEKKVRETLKELGAKAVLAFAPKQDLEGYLARLGYNRLATVWKREV